MNEDIGNIIRKLHNELQRKMTNFAKKYDLTAMQMLIISLIDQREKIGKMVFQKDIEEEFNIRRASVTNIVQLMEKKNLITREPLKEDVRYKQLVLTNSSRKYAKYLKEYEQDIEEVLKKVTSKYLDNDDVTEMLQEMLKCLGEGKI